MTNIDTGTYGAKRQTFEKASPRGILLELRRRHPRATKESLLQKFQDRVIDDVEMLKPIIAYWFAGNFTSMEPRPAPKTPQQRERETKQRAAKVEDLKTEIKTRAARMVLLDLVLPSGKMLRDSTGRDCLKAGGLFTAIGNAIKTTEVVGKVLSEAQVRKFWPK